jgi:hypothetical protein
LIQFSAELTKAFLVLFLKALDIETLYSAKKNRHSAGFFRLQTLVPRLIHQLVFLNPRHFQALKKPALRLVFSLEGRNACKRSGHDAKVVASARRA